MDRARDILEPARCVPPDMSVHDLAELLLNEGLDGVCVTDVNGTLVGVITSMDLVFQEKKPRLPTMLYLMDAVIPIGNLERSRREIRRITAVRVEELMTTEVVTVGPEATIDEIATRMVERHLTVLPVVDQGQLVGMITKPALLRAAHHLARAT